MPSEHLQRRKIVSLNNPSLPFDILFFLHIKNAFFVYGKKGKRKFTSENP